MALWVQDYARLHDYECVAASSLADQGLRFMWNKVAWLQLTMQVQAGLSSNLKLAEALHLPTGQGGFTSNLATGAHWHEHHAEQKSQLAAGCLHRGSEPAVRHMDAGITPIALSPADQHRCHQVTSDGADWQPTLEPSYECVFSMLLVLTVSCAQDWPDAEWYLWIDSDTVIIDVAFTLPFQEYAGSDLVIWGNETRLMAGDGRHGEHRWVQQALYHNVL